jgi:hypothetical protein
MRGLTPKTRKYASRLYPGLINHITSTVMILTAACLSHLLPPCILLTCRPCQVHRSPGRRQDDYPARRSLGRCCSDETRRRTIIAEATVSSDTLEHRQHRIDAECRREVIQFNNYLPACHFSAHFSVAFSVVTRHSRNRSERPWSPMLISGTLVGLNSPPPRHLRCFDFQKVR